LQGRRKLEGTLAFDPVDLASLGGRVVSINDALALLYKATLRGSDHIDLDLRLSAETASIGGLKAGPVALAFTSGENNVAIDIAELGLYQGTMSGRIDCTPAAASIRATGRGIDLDALSQAFTVDLPITGKADFSFNSKQSMSDGPAAGPGPRSGHFYMNVLASEVLSSELLRDLNVAQARVKQAQAPFEISNISALELRGDFDTDRLKAELSGHDENTALSGAVIVKRGDLTLTGHLDIEEDAPQSEPAAIAATASKPSSKVAIDISGTVANPVFGTLPRHSLSN
jgi:hypothetical protein